MCNRKKRPGEMATFSEIAPRPSDSRGLKGEERYSCIFFGHGHETLRASEGNVCLEDVPRLPERHLREPGFLGASKRAHRMSGPVEKSDV